MSTMQPTEAHRKLWTALYNLAHREIFEDYAESSDGPATQLIADFEARAVQAAINAELAAERERVRVLREHGVESLMIARSWQMVWGVALKLCAAVYSCAVLTTATLVPTVADPVLIVKSPTRVVEKLPIVPVVELRVAIVPWVRIAEPWLMLAVLAVSVCTVPLVILAAVDVVVPAVSVGIVPSVIVAVLDVRLGIVPVVIVALVLIVRLPVAVP